MSDKIEIRKRDSGKTIASIELCLLTVCKLIGIKTPPDVIQLREFAEFIIKYWNMTDAMELKSAIDYAIANGVEHYGAMDKTFIARSLNAYKASKPAQLPKVIGYIAVEPRSGKQSYEALTTYLESGKDFPLFWDWDKLFEYMVTVGKVKAEVYTEEVCERMRMQIVAQEKKRILMNTNAGKSEIIIQNELERVGDNLETQLHKQIIKQIMTDEKSDIETTDGNEAQNEG